MDELEALRQKKLQEMQNQNQAQAQEQQNQAQAEAQLAQLEQLARQVLTKEAMQRYGTLKMAHPDKAIHALLLVAQLVQQRRLKQLDDEGFKDLLRQLDTGKKDITITRK